MVEHVPATLGYRLAAEWEPHAATWLSWPRRRATWPGKFEPIPDVWAQLVRNLAPYEPVHICAGGEAVMDEARAMVGSVPNVFLHDIATNDAWARDHGPMFLKYDGDYRKPALVDWEFNSWGGKYPPFDLDNAVPAQVARITGHQVFKPGMILEGGAIDTNGQGTLLTTETCLLNPNRNPKLSKGHIEGFLHDFCCAKKILWLGGGIVGDDTDGHIDELARFVEERTVVCAIEEDSQDVNYEPLQDNLRRLQTMSDAYGRSLEIVPIPMPRPLYFRDQRLPACYMNFYIANGVVIVPVFNDPADKVALATLARLFPDRQIVGQNAVDLVWGRGALHCITQQQPA